MKIQKAGTMAVNETIGVKEEHMIRVPGVGHGPIPRPVLVEHHDQPLSLKLDVEASDHLLAGLPADLVLKFRIIGQALKFQRT